MYVFRIVAYSTNNFSKCGPQQRKIIGIVAYPVEKWSALLATRRKIVEFKHLHSFETISFFYTLGFQSGA
jgi:hypothetical protein